MGADVREFSVPAAVTVGDSANLTDPVWDNAAAAAGDVQFRRRVGGQWRDVTCAEFRDEVVAVARGLIASGVEPGTRVALMSRTRYEWTLFDYAIWAAGGVTVPIYETSSAEQVAWVLSDSGATACVVETNAHALLLSGVRDQLPKLERVWQIDLGAVDDLTTAGSTPTTATRSTATRSTATQSTAIPATTTPATDTPTATAATAAVGVDPAAVEERRRAVRADDVATIIYTSGTTGRPKGCVLTHRNMLADAANAVAVLPELFHRGASTLLFLPLAHAFARLIQVGMVQARATMGHTADTKNLSESLQEYRPTFVLSVPRVFEKVHAAARLRAEADGKGKIFDRAERVAIRHSQAMDDPASKSLRLTLEHAMFDRLVYGKLRAALGGRCGYAISGGAPLGERLAHFFRGVGITVFEGYGLTETAPAAAANVANATRIGTVGRPLPGVAIRVADDGEILVSGPIVFRGYWNNQGATDEAIDSDGWFHTGDLGELDADGFLKITGRKKEIIVTAGGKNVAPAVLEDRLRAHPLISQAVVVGDRRPFVAALVTIDEDAWPRWLAGAGHPAGTPVAELREDRALAAAVQEAVDAANRAVSQAEAIKSVRILPRDFSEATGELTPSLKVKRAVVQKEYAAEIDAIYAR